MQLGENIGCFVVADNPFAMQSQYAASISRPEPATNRVQARYSVPASSSQSFARSFGSDSATAAVSNAAVPTFKETRVPQKPSGRGILGMNAQLMLAESRTQAAQAAFPAPPNVNHANTVYLANQKSVQNTRLANGGSVYSLPDAGYQPTHQSETEASIDADSA